MYMDIPLKSELALLLNTFAFIRKANIKFKGFNDGIPKNLLDTGREEKVKKVKSASKPKKKVKLKEKAKKEVKTNKVTKSFIDLIMGYQSKGYSDRESIEKAYNEMHGSENNHKKATKKKTVKVSEEKCPFDP